MWFLRTLFTADPQSADGWIAVETAMRPTAIVVQEPGLQRRGAHFRLGIGADIGPFPQQGLDEAFGLAVGLGPIGSGSQVAQAQGAASVAEEDRTIGRAVVRQDAPDVNPQALEPGHGPTQ